MAIETFRKFPNEFNLLYEDLIFRFMALHDQSKINHTRSFLIRHSIADRKHLISHDLFAIYGRWNQLPPGQKTKALRLRDELNKIDQQVAFDFFEKNRLLDKNGNPNKAAKQLLRLEKIADITDTVLNPNRAKEFGQKVHRIGVAKAYGLEKEAIDKEIAHKMVPYYLRRAHNPKDKIFE